MTVVTLGRRVTALERAAAAHVSDRWIWAIEPEGLDSAGQAAWLVGVEAANPDTNIIVHRIIDPPQRTGGAP